MLAMFVAVKEIVMEELVTKIVLESQQLPILISLVLKNMAIMLIQTIVPNIISVTMDKLFITLVKSVRNEGQL